MILDAAAPDVAIDVHIDAFEATDGSWRIDVGDVLRQVSAIFPTASEFNGLVHTGDRVFGCNLEQCPQPLSFTLDDPPAWLSETSSAG